MISVLLGSAAPAAVMAAEALDDPMRPPNISSAGAARPAAASRSYTLSSIVIGVERRIAIVNGRTVTVGDRVGSATVVDIQPSGVTLNRDGGRFELNLVALDVKQNAKKPEQ